MDSEMANTPLCRNHPYGKPDPLETLAREWLESKSFMASTWTPTWKDELIGSLTALLRKVRDERNQILKSFRAKVLECSEVIKERDRCREEGAEYIRRTDPMLKRLKDTLDEIAERLEKGTLHRLVCNANHEQKTGGGMCICNPLKEERDRLEAELKQWKEGSPVEMQALYMEAQELGRKEAQVKIKAAMALHVPGQGALSGYCVQCKRTWPCPTVKALR